MLTRQNSMKNYLKTEIWKYLQPNCLSQYQ